MSCNQLGEGPSKERLVMGINLFAPISSDVGSPSLYYSQPLLNGSVFASSAIIIGTELILFIASRIFCLDSIPVLDVKTGQTVQMPLSELQEFLKWMLQGTDNTTNLTFSSNGRNMLSTDRNLPEERGFPTPERPEAPLILAIFVSGDFSNRLYSPYITMIFPIFTFPGLRGALPLLILAIIGTIFIRAVVLPDTTGAMPLVKPDALNKSNKSINLSPTDLLELLTRFGKHFGTK